MMGKQINGSIEIAKNDLIRAWQILEEMRVSLDRIGGYFAEEPDKMRLELDKYFSPNVWKKISNASFVLAKYLSEKERENISEGFNYYQ